MTLYDIIDEIQDRTAMYVGDGSILQLRAFLSGFSWAENKLGVKLAPETPSFGDFHDWIAEKFGWYESTAGWANIIRQEYDGDEQRAGRAFFEWLSEFRNEKQLAPDDPRP